MQRKTLIVALFLDECKIQFELYNITPRLVLFL